MIRHVVERCAIENSCGQFLFRQTASAPILSRFSGARATSSIVIVVVIVWQHSFIPFLPSDALCVMCVLGIHLAHTANTHHSVDTYVIPSSSCHSQETYQVKLCNERAPMENESHQFREIAQKKTKLKSIRWMVVRETKKKKQRMKTVQCENFP